MARIVVDLEKLRVLECGLGQFSRDLARELIKCKQPADELIYFVPRERQYLFREDPVKLLEVKRSQKACYTRPIQGIASKIVPGPRYDVWHTTSQCSRYEPWNPKVPVLLTIHDLNFLREKSKKSAARMLRSVQHRVNRASRLTAISQFVADEVRQHLDTGGKPLEVVHNGAAKIGTRPGITPRGVPNTPFLFSLGCFMEKKNFHTLVRMMQHLPGLNLVIAGIKTTGYGHRVEEEISQLGLADRVFLPGIIDDAGRDWCFQNCLALVFPSLTEGFGLPPIEAMSAGKPVFLSELTSLPEVGGEEAFYWNNFEPSYMADVVRHGLQEALADGFADRMRRRADRFTWSNAARRYSEIYQEIIDEQQGRQPRQHTLETPEAA